jgi:hypothetical protein
MEEISFKNASGWTAVLAALCGEIELATDVDPYH